MTDAKYGFVIEAIDRLSAPAEKMRKQLEDLEKAAQHVGKVTGISALGRSISQAGHAFSEVGTRGREIIKTFGELALVGAGGGFLGEHLVKPAIEMEHLSFQLQQLTGSATSGKDALHWIEEFTLKSPFDIKKTADAFIYFRKLGLDPTKGALQAVSDFAVTTGQDIGDVASALGKGALGQAKGLKQLGVTTTQDKGTGVTQYHIANTATGQMFNSEKFNIANRAAAVDQLVKLLNLSYSGAGEKWSHTLEGSIKRLTDLWHIFRVQVMDAGAFKYISGQVNALADRLTKMFKTGQMEEWANKVGSSFLHLSQSFVNALPGMLSLLEGVASGTQKVVDVFGGWDRLLKAIALVTAVQFAASLVGLGVEIAAIAVKLATLSGPLKLIILAAEAAALAYSLSKEYADRELSATQRWLIPEAGMSRASGLSPVSQGPQSFADFANVRAAPLSPVDVSREIKTDNGKIHIQLQSDIPMSIYRVQAENYDPTVGTTTMPGVQ